MEMSFRILKIRKQLVFFSFNDPLCLLSNQFTHAPGIFLLIRNKLKVTGTVTNAKKFIEIQKQHDSFDKFIWQFTDHKTIKNNWNDVKQVPPRTDHSDKMSKALYEEGFKFVGSTICYAFMQATGMVNDHLVKCHWY